VFPNSKGKETAHLSRHVKDLGTKRSGVITNMTLDKHGRGLTTREGGEEYKTVRVKNYKTNTRLAST